MYSPITASGDHRRCMTDLRTPTLAPSDKLLHASDDLALPMLTSELAKAPNGHASRNSRDADRTPLDGTLRSANCGGGVAPAWPWPQVRRAWRLVRWRMVAIISFTLISTLLVACLAVATLNVVLRRESTNVIEKEIITLVGVSKSIAPAILNRAACDIRDVNSGELKPLTRYVQGAFPQARISLALLGHKTLGRLELFAVLL